ncbi:MAG: hypothetical protein IT425_04320 [Pirellulales bacterium]|nr:hypothetical protein [Pirellulales bacterium]
MSRTDLVLLAFVAYFAVMSLVRLMRARRDALVSDVQRQVEARRGRRRPNSGTAKKGRDAA